MTGGRRPAQPALGTDERSWAAWPWLSTLPGAGLAGLAKVTSAVVVAAHPDAVRPAPPEETLTNDDVAETLLFCSASDALGS